MRYLGVDPGGTHGLFVLELENTTYDFHPAKAQNLDDLYRAIHDFSPDLIVCENFDRRQKPGEIVLIIEGITICKLYSEQIGIPLELQSASYGKGFWDDNKMKRVGLHFPGKDGKHATDAARHVLQYVSERVKDRRFIMMLKPEDFTA